MSFLLVLLFVWVVSPIALIPMLIYAFSKKKKLERFKRQLLDEKRISFSEYRSNFSEKTSEAMSELTRPYYAVQQTPVRPPQTFGTFIGPPLPPELLQKRREQSAAAAAAPAPDAVRDVSHMIAESAKPETVDLTKPSLEAVTEISLEKQETVQPALEAVTEIALEKQEPVQPTLETVAETAPEQPEPVQSALEAVTEIALEKQEPVQPSLEAVAETAPEQPEPVRPAVGMLGNFIGPPLPPEILAERRAIAAAAETRPAQPVQSVQPAPFAQPVQHKKHTVNPASAMLIIGSALVVIAGMIFSTAKWNDMTD